MKAILFLVLAVIAGGFCADAMICPNLTENSALDEQNMTWMCEVIEWRKELAQLKKLIERECSISDEYEYWRLVFACPDFSEMICLKESSFDNVTDFFNCSIPFCTDGQYDDENFLQEVWIHHYNIHRNLISVVRNNLSYCLQSKESNVTCPDVNENSTAAEMDMVWMCELIKWRNALAAWKERVEDELAEKEKNEDWQSIFECPNLTELACQDEFSSHDVTDSFNCTFSVCKNGKYVDDRALNEIGRQHHTIRERVMSAISTESGDLSISEGGTSSEDTSDTGDSAESALTTEDNVLERNFVDVIFVLDGSSSIGISNFDLVKHWTINQTLKIYEKFGSFAQVEVLQYSNKDPAFLGVEIEDSTLFEIPFVFGECVNNESCVTERMNNMRYLNSATYTYYALRRATEWEFLQSPRYDFANRVVVVMTDGEATEANKYLIAWWNEYAATGIVVPFAVGVMDYAEFYYELSTIANGGVGDARVFTVDSFAMLDQIDISVAIAEEIF